MPREPTPGETGTWASNGDAALTRLQAVPPGLFPNQAEGRTMSLDGS